MKHQGLGSGAIFLVGSAWKGLLLAILFFGFAIGTIGYWGWVILLGAYVFLPREGLYKPITLFVSGLWCFASILYLVVRRKI